MATLDIPKTRELLHVFDFKKLFIEELGWSRPTSARAAPFSVGGRSFERRQIAQLSGVAVFEITGPDGEDIPDAKTRALLHKELSASFHENLLIFVDRQRTKSLWYWVKRDDGRVYPREHLYVRGQPGDLFLGKLSAIVVDISEFDETGNVPVTVVARRLRDALDVERVTKKFYKEYREQHEVFVGQIEGIGDERDQRWYASVVLDRLMFIYFLQRKLFLDGGDERYLQHKLGTAPRGERYWFYDTFLQALFFEGFARPQSQRSEQTKRLVGEIKFLNGGLFLHHPVEQRWPDIRIPDKAFAAVFRLFESYSWNLNDTPGGDDNEINPDVLGYIFEKYINQKAFGAYYTRPEITGYLCEQTIYKLILERVNSMSLPGRGAPRQSGFLTSQDAMFAPRRFESMPDLLINLDANLCRRLLWDVLPDLSILDPACGSGAFLVAAMKTLINIYAAAIGKIEFLGDHNLKSWLARQKAEHPSLNYFIKKQIITNNLFGVDLMEEGTEIAKLRLFLVLVASAAEVDDLEPLPNIDFNIVAGNSLVGLLRVDEKDFDEFYPGGTLLRKSYSTLLAEKNTLIDRYRKASSLTDDLEDLRDQIREMNEEARVTLNELLLKQFENLGIRFEEATWDEKKNKEGRPRKRPVKLADIERLKPFHWGYEFDRIINTNRGFDVILTNPPWEVFQTDEKEFYQEYAPTIQKNKLRIEDWLKQRVKLMKEPGIRKAWLDYASQFPHVSAYFKKSSQYKNQISIINGRNVGSKINLYSYFIEQCYNLLAPGGLCGVVVPSGIYTDMSTTQLRRMLFDSAEITGLFGFENRKGIFENVDSRFKFVVLTFSKSGQTETFPAAFMRHDVTELELFPKSGALNLSTALIERLSPESLSLMEFRSETDIGIAERVFKFPLLGQYLDDEWNLTFTQEFNMTTDNGLFKPKCKPGYLPLYEGKMIHQFDHLWAEPRYWLDEKEAREVLVNSRLGQIKKLIKAADLDLELEDIDPDSLALDYTSFRLGFRDIAASTNERTMIMTVLPRDVFCPHTMSLENVYRDEVVDDELRLNISSMDGGSRLFAAGVLNSFVVDFLIRMKVTTHLSFFFVYNLPVPRLDEDDDSAFRPIMERAARLVCTTEEFKDLWEEVMPGSRWSQTKAATQESERARLRAELDGLVAHLYELTEEEFAYILTTFPLVPEAVKVAARNAYRDAQRGLVK